MAPDLNALYSEHVDVISARADAALARGGFDHLVVPAGVLKYQLFDDRDYPFAVNPQFKAWLPVTQAPGSWIVHTPGKKPRLIYLQPHDYWHVVPEAPSGYWVDSFEIEIIRTASEATALLPGTNTRCAVLGDADSAIWPMVPNNPAPVVQYLEYHRAYKTAYEIEMMREATRMAVRAHRAAERAFRAGSSEFGIHLAYCQAARQDVIDLPYRNIVALNEHAAVLHYTGLDTLPPKPVRSFLIDAGASFNGYASDITRTYAMEDGPFDSLIQAMDRVQRELADKVRAGTDYRNLHLDAHLSIARVLREFDFIHVDPEVAVETGVSAAFFPHGLGHGIGLQVHDVAGFAENDAGGSRAKPEGHPYLRLTRDLAPGMVVTIEPGLYFIDMLLEALKDRGLGPSVNWNTVDAFRPYGGIRIEDDVVCTEDAPLNLTRSTWEATP